MSSWIHNPKTVVTLVAGCAGWLSAFFAARNSRTARAQLKLAASQEDRRHAPIRAALIEGCYEVQHPYRLYIFSVALTNPSDRANSVVKATLEIHYRNSSGTEHTAYVENLAPRYGNQSALRVDREMQIPIQLAAGAAVSGLLCFKVNSELLTPMVIDSYTLVLMDSRDGEVSIPMVMLREIRAQDDVAP